MTPEQIDIQPTQMTEVVSKQFRYLLGKDLHLLAFRLLRQLPKRADIHRIMAENMTNLNPLLQFDDPHYHPPQDGYELQKGLEQASTWLPGGYVLGHPYVQNTLLNALHTPWRKAFVYNAYKTQENPDLPPTTRISATRNLIFFWRLPVFGVMARLTPEYQEHAFPLYGAEPDRQLNVLENLAFIADIKRTTPSKLLKPDFHLSGFGDPYWYLKKKSPSIFDLHK